MIRTRRERFDPTRPLVAIKPLTVNGEALSPGDEVSMQLPVGLRKRMWKARRCVHKGSRLDGKIISGKVKPTGAPEVSEDDSQTKQDKQVSPEKGDDSSKSVEPMAVPDPEKIGKSYWGYPSLSKEKHRSKKLARAWYVENQKGDE